MFKPTRIWWIKCLWMRYWWVKPSRSSVQEWDNCQSKRQRQASLTFACTFHSIHHLSNTEDLWSKSYQQNLFSFTSLNNHRTNIRQSREGTPQIQLSLFHLKNFYKLVQLPPSWTTPHHITGWCLYIPWYSHDIPISPIESIVHCLNHQMLVA